MSDMILPVKVDDFMRVSSDPISHNLHIYSIITSYLTPFYVSVAFHFLLESPDPASGIVSYLHCVDIRQPRSFKEQPLYSFLCERMTQCVRWLTDSRVKSIFIQRAPFHSRRYLMTL